MHEKTAPATVDLPVDLNSEDDTGLPWGFLDESRTPAKITAVSYTHLTLPTNREV